MPVANQTTHTRPLERLTSLVTEGRLRFVYVVGVARSNSTVVVRMLGERLDGAVYEPTTPNSGNVRKHHAQTILDAYDAARRELPEPQPVLLAIKDLSLFLDDATYDFILAHAEHIVVTVRDPLMQHASLVRQFKHEFSLGQRADALIRYPVEVSFLTYYLFKLGARFLATASRRFGFAPTRLHRLLMAGWNLTSWEAVERQHDEAVRRLGPSRVTVLDAGLMRLLPDAATAALEAIAASLRDGRPPSAHPVEVAGHSRMFADSEWAKEARASDHIKPLAAGAAPKRPRDAFDEALLAAFYPHYGALFYGSSNRLLPLAAGQRGTPGSEQMAHLLASDTAEAALGALRESRSGGRPEWRNETASAK